MASLPHHGPADTEYGRAAPGYVGMNSDISQLLLQNEIPCRHVSLDALVMPVAGVHTQKHLFVIMNLSNHYKIQGTSWQQ